MGLEDIGLSGNRLYDMRIERQCSIARPKWRTCCHAAKGIFACVADEASRFRIVDVDPEAEIKPRETPSRRALQIETRGLIFIAVAILIVYPCRYCQLLHRSAP
jgi:hypothetical protein